MNPVYAAPHIRIIASSCDVWSSGPDELTLADHEVHVWRAQLELYPDHMQRLKSILTEDELMRADRLLFARDRQRFVAARGTLRSILSRYVPVTPADLRFEYNRYGKPFLAPGFTSTLLRFNFSYSDGMALFAIARNMEIGVDIEHILPDVEYEEIGKYFFTANEMDTLRSLPTGMQLEAFYSFWTRKEACIKAYGKGFSLPLDSFDVSFFQREPVMRIMTKVPSQESSLWRLLDLQPDPGYMGALAVNGRGCTFKFWEWNQQ